jgi:hypothetical protein
MLIGKCNQRFQLSESLKAPQSSLRCTRNRLRPASRDIGSCKWQAAPATAVLYLPSTATSASRYTEEPETHTERLREPYHNDSRHNVYASVSISASLDSALDSADAVYSVPLQHRKQRWRQRHHQLTLKTTPTHLQLPDSELVAKFCPVVAAAILLPAVLMLVVPQHMLQLVAVTSSTSLATPTAAAEAVSSSFVQLVGLTWAFNAMLSLVVKVRPYRRDGAQQSTLASTAR